MNKLIPIFLIVVFGVLLQRTEAAVVEVDVTVKSVDVTSRTVTVAYETKEGNKAIDLDVCRKATITVNGKPETLDSVKSGQKATVTYDRELATITKIAIGTANQSSLAKGNEDRPFIVTVGPMKSLMPPGANGLYFFPDQCLQVIQSNPLSYIMVAKNSTYLMTGRSFGEAKPIRCLLEPGKSGQFDSGYAGAGGLFHLADRKEWLLFYHAEDHEGMGRNPNNNIPNGYWSVGMAVFNEKTGNVTKLGQVLRASIPKNVTAGNHGVGDVVVVADPSRKYLYLYYFDLTRQKGSTSQIGLARCAISDGGRPGKWFKYHEGQFTEPGLGGKEGGIITRAWSPSIQYIHSFGCYLMTCDRVYQMDAERETPQDGGIHWCYSKDGIHWSEPQLIVPGLPLPVIGRSNTSHSSLVIEHEDENSVTGTLFYGYTPRRERTPASGRHLVCRSIKFTKRNPSEALADPLPQIWPTVKELKPKCRKIETSKHQEVLVAEISQQPLTPLDIRAVASLRTPQRLVAQECGITDEAMRYFVGLPHLEHLDLRGNPITDASVDILCELKGLTALDIRDTKISSEGRNRLGKALQSCQIVGP